MASHDPAPERLSVGMSLLSQDAAQFTGTATYVRSIVSELGRRDHGVDVELWCNEHTVAADVGQHDNVFVRRAKGFRVGSSPHTRRAALLAARAAPALLSQQFSHDLDVVHYPLTLMVPKVRRPMVTTLHDLLHHDLPQYFSHGELTWRRLFYDSAARSATLVIADSEHARARIIDRLDIAPDNVVAISMAVDDGRFCPDPDSDDSALATQLSLPEHYVFYPASLWPHKNHKPLIDAMAQTGDDELHLVLSGASFGRLGEIASHAAARGMEDRVRHLGTVPDDALPVLYRRAKALVFPSSYEGFGLPPLEAMACGCPVASSHAASLAEVCGEASIALDPSDPSQMACAIRSVVHDGGLRERLRVQGLDRARRFSWAASADAHVVAFRRAAEIGG